MLRRMSEKLIYLLRRTLRKTWWRCALFSAFAVLGVVGTSMNVMELGELFAGEAERPAAVVVSSITFVLLIVYIIVGVRSFIQARRWKDSRA